MALEQEFATYRRELRRLLDEGHANRHALIKGDEIISIWDTQRDALQAGHERYGLEPFAVCKLDELSWQRLQLWEKQQMTMSGHNDDSRVKALKQEIQTYRRELQRLLDEGHADRYALIKGDEIIGIWDQQTDALEVGRDRFGLVPIAVKKIDPKDIQRFQLLDQQKKATCPSSKP
jgi:hypothetical protein